MWGPIESEMEKYSALANLLLLMIWVFLLLPVGKFEVENQLQSDKTINNLSTHLPHSAAVSCECKQST